MLHASGLLLFLGAALLLAVTPGPGIFYVAARTLTGGRGEGLASSLGTAGGGLVHVAGGALGVSTLVMTSVEAFAILKTIGAGYLVWLGCKTIWQARREWHFEVASAGHRRAFCDGVVVEALNPKTAMFFLAFVPQFVDPSQNVAMQFMLLGSICVVLNTAADLVVVGGLAKARARLDRPSAIKRIRQASGIALCGLGASLLLARRST